MDSTAGQASHLGTLTLGSPSKPPQAHIKALYQNPSPAFTLYAPPATSNPYVSTTPAPDFTGKSTTEVISNYLSKWGKMVEETAGSVWQHIKTSPNLVDMAWGRLNQGTKLLAEGGSENIFKHTFNTLPDERLRDSYACFLSTSAGPVAGTLFVSTKRIAFSSDRPLSYQHTSGQTIWSYYKVVVPVDKLRMANASKNPRNPSEKYIQIISTDNYEFWYMGFLNHDKALKTLQEAKVHST